MLGRLAPALALFALISQTCVLADSTATRAVFPAWAIYTSEEAWANSELRDCLKRYPISSLIDGDVSTAWVFEGVKWDGKETDHWYRPATGTAFLGGIGQQIAIHHRGSTAPPLVDALGIVNGYAKSPNIYARNNRITRLRIEVSGPTQAALARSRMMGPEVSVYGAGQPAWEKTVDLQEAMWMQIIPLPETRADRITLTVQEVEPGGDDDLCVSEIQLYHQGRALIPRPQPFSLYSPGSECGCGDAIHVLDSRGRQVHHQGLAAVCYWCIHSFSPSGRLVALSVGDEGGLAVVDLVTGRIMHEIPGMRDVVGLIWEREASLRVSTRSHETQAETQYRLRLGERPPVLEQVPPGTQ